LGWGGSWVGGGGGEEVSRWCALKQRQRETEGDRDRERQKKEGRSSSLDNVAHTQHRYERGGEECNPSPSRTPTPGLCYTRPTYRHRMYLCAVFQRRRLSHTRPETISSITHGQREEMMSKPDVSPPSPPGSQLHIPPCALAREHPTTQPRLFTIHQHIDSPCTKEYSNRVWRCSYIWFPGMKDRDLPCVRLCPLCQSTVRVPRLVQLIVALRNQPLTGRKGHCREYGCLVTKVW
jgi:hypothetical protein